MHDAKSLWQPKSIGYRIDLGEDHEWSNNVCVLSVLEAVSLNVKTYTIVTKDKVACVVAGLIILRLSW